jgi:ribosome-interacting GTPase 1
MLLCIPRKFLLFKTYFFLFFSVKHQPQRVGKDHVLEDEDVVQIVKKV